MEPPLSVALSQSPSPSLFRRKSLLYSILLYLSAYCLSLSFFLFLSLSHSIQSVSVYQQREPAFSPVCLSLSQFYIFTFLRSYEQIHNNVYLKSLYYFVVTKRKIYIFNYTYIYISFSLLLYYYYN